MYSRITNLLKKSAFNTVHQRQYITVKAQFSSYDGLFAHTLKNHGRHLAFDFNLKTPAVEHLCAAIKTGNPDAEIFSDPRCHLYLLYLVKNNHIEFWQGMTVYTYLMALMQFTRKQPLHPNDSALKNAEYTHAGVKIEPLVINKQVTDFGKKYFTEVQTKLAKLKVNIDADLFFQFVADLSPIDSWMLRINFANEIIPYQKGYDKVARIIIENSPFILLEITKHISHYYTPSFSVIRHLLKQISPHPLELRPILGKISDPAFQLLHQHHYHPVALYDPNSEDNLVKPHYIDSGPYTTMLHDAVGHAFWGSLLTRAERESIFSTFIPELKKMLETAAAYPLDKNKLHITPSLSFTGRFKQAILNAADFDLTDLTMFTNPNTRFLTYLARTFGNQHGDFLHPAQLLKNCPYLAIGDCQEDHVYFLLKKHFYQNIAPTEPLGLWHTFLTFLEKNTNKDSQCPDIFKALEVLAQLATGQEILAPTRKTKVDWPTWQLLLEKYNDSDSIWYTAKRKHHTQLLALITDYHLDFFPPLYPLNDEKIQSFKDFVNAKIQSQNDMTWPQFCNSNAEKTLKIKL